MKVIIFVIVIMAGVVSGAVVAVVYWNRPTPVKQPIAFNHQRHIEGEELECVFCHEHVETQPHATLPFIDSCLMCHEEPQGNHPDESKIRNYAKRGEEIPWIQVNRLPGDVYFSHQVHVTFSKMDCKECHGNMSKQKEPVSLPNIAHLNMSKCMECHREKRVAIDCLRCHK